MRAALVLLALAGCAELGVISDGTSISIGRPSRGHLVDGNRLPDHGEGFTTRPTWSQRGNRYGTDELLDLITAVGRRMKAQFVDTALVVADLSGKGGGESRKWHRSHQSGRDVDFVYYMRDAQGQPFEADAMRAFDASGKARDGSGITIDIPRTWLLIRELVTAHEAIVQYVFIYEPIAVKLLEHAVSKGEPEALIARARMTLKQPGDSAPHHDHMHVRVYCSARDRAYGCVDIGPRELLAEREAERERDGDVATIVASLVSGAAQAGVSQVVTASVLGSPPDTSSVIAAPQSLHSLPALGQMIRTRSDLLLLRR